MKQMSDGIMKFSKHCFLTAKIPNTTLVPSFGAVTMTLKDHVKQTFPI